LLVIAVACLAVACKARPQSLAERVRARILAELPALTVTVDDAQSLTVQRGEWKLEMSLDNVGLRCRTDPPACDEAIAKTVANLRYQLAQEDGKANPFTRDKLALTLKTAADLDQVDAMMKEKRADKYQDNKLVTAPMAGDLRVVLAFDLPNGIMLSSQASLRKLSLDEAAAFALARKNLAEARPSLLVSPMPGERAVYTNDQDDDYISALMALPDRWKPLAETMKGGLIASFPARNRIYVTDVAHAKELAQLTAAAYEREDHALSKSLFRWSPAGFTPFDAR
jgi:hypothetical protein